MANTTYTINVASGDIVSQGFTLAYGAKDMPCTFGAETHPQDRAAVREIFGIRSDLMLPTSNAPFLTPPTTIFHKHHTQNGRFYLLQRRKKEVISEITFIGVYMIKVTLLGIFCAFFDSKAIGAQ